jgi:predicted solute-binding protein
VVADAKATLDLFERWQPVLQRVWATVNEADVDAGAAVHQPIAPVAQDGLERLPVPWEQFQALFVGRFAATGDA